MPFGIGRVFCLALWLSLLVPTLAWADQIWIGRLPPQEVQIRGFENDQLLYIVGSRERQTPLDEVVRIELDGNDRFNAAEEAFQAGDWQVASQQYSQVLDRRGGEDWVRRRSTFRLVDAAARAGLFREAVDGFVSMTGIDPVAAATRQPNPERENVDARQVADARSRVQTALTGASDDARRRALLAYMLRLDNALGDSEAAANTVRLLTPLVSSTVPENQADWPLFARVTIGRASLQLGERNPAAARRLIEDASAVFTNEEQKADALMLLADAARLEAGDDRAKKLDAALAYVRVAAQAPEIESIAARALVAAGDIHAELSLDEDAAALWRQAADRYPSSAAGATAAEKLKPSDAAK
jgi:TolA-binding protein